MNCTRTFKITKVNLNELCSSSIATDSFCSFRIWTFCCTILSFLLVHFSSFSAFPNVLPLALTASHGQYGSGSHEPSENNDVLIPNSIFNIFPWWLLLLIFHSSYLPSVYGAGVQTHNLLIVSLLSLSLKIQIWSFLSNRATKLLINTLKQE